MSHGQSTSNLLTGMSSVSTSCIIAKFELRAIRTVGMSCCNVEVDHTQRLSSLLLDNSSCLLSCALQQHLLVENDVRGTEVEGHEEEHPITLALRNHVEDTAERGHERERQRAETGMLYII